MFRELVSLGVQAAGTMEPSDRNEPPQRPSLVRWTLQLGTVLCSKPFEITFASDHGSGLDLWAPDRRPELAAGRSAHSHQLPWPRGELPDARACAAAVRSGRARDSVFVCVWARVARVNSVDLCLCPLHPGGADLGDDPVTEQERVIECRPWFPVGEQQPAGHLVDGPARGRGDLIDLQAEDDRGDVSGGVDLGLG